MWTLSTYLRLIQAGLVYIFFLYAGWIPVYVCDLCIQLHMGNKDNYTHRYLYKCLFVLVLFRVMIVLVFYFVDFILCKSLTRDEGCKLALCYMPYIHGIGWLCVTMPSVLSLLNKLTNKQYEIWQGSGKKSAKGGFGLSVAMSKLYYLER